MSESVPRDPGLCQGPSGTGYFFYKVSHLREKSPEG